MDFELTESQKILRKTARDVLETECPKTLVREMELDEKGYLPQLQRKMADRLVGANFPRIVRRYGGRFRRLDSTSRRDGTGFVTWPIFLHHSSRRLAYPRNWN